MSKVTKQGEPGLGPKSPDSLLKLKIFQYTSGSATKHPLTHTHAYQYPSHHKPIHSQRVTAPIGHGDLLSLPSLVEQLGPTPFTPSIRKACLGFPSNLPSGHLHTSSLNQLAGWGSQRHPLSSPTFRPRWNWHLTLDKRIRTHCPVAPPIIPPQTSVLAFAKTDPSKSPCPI